MTTAIWTHARTDRRTEGRSARRAVSGSSGSWASWVVPFCALLAAASTASGDDRFRLDVAPDDCVEVEVSGVLDASMERVRSVLLDLEGLGRWYPATHDWRILEHHADRALVYGRQRIPWPVGDRDYVVLYRWRTEPGGEFVLEAASVTGIGPAPPEGVIRVPYLWSRWRLRVDGAGTAVDYHYRGDPGGSLPIWLARTGWRSQTGRVIEGLRGEVERRGAKDGL